MRGVCDGLERGEPDDPGAVVVLCQYEGGLSCDGEGQDMADLAFYGEAVEGRDGEAILSSIEENSAVVGVVASHLDIIFIEVTEQEDIGEAVGVDVCNGCVPVGGQLGLPGKGRDGEIAVSVVDEDSVGEVVGGEGISPAKDVSGEQVGEGSFGKVFCVEEVLFQ